jgi:hypothetical protein
MIHLLLIASLAIENPADPVKENKLPPEAEQALGAPGKVTLYSLEPWDRPTPGDKTLRNVKVLGQTELDEGRGAKAIAKLKAAVSGWDGMMSAYFDPSYALRVTAKEHTYDFLLCYECHLLAVYQDDQLLTTLGASGSPKVLNELLSAAKLPLSKSAEKIAAQYKVDEAVEARWREAMPKSIKPLWDDVPWTQFNPNVAPLRSALAQEFPDARQRILVLFAWYGSGAGSWSRFPKYEEIAETLLLEYPTPELIASLETETLTEPQLEGAARLFGRYTFGYIRPDEDRGALPAPLKKKLLDHSLKSTDEDKLLRARSAFGQP